MSMFVKPALLALLVLPGAATAESEPAGKSSPPKTTRPEVHAELGTINRPPIRCRIYFGCAPAARSASATAHPVPEQLP